MTGSSRALLIPPISSATPGALYQQVVDGISREISEGRLAPGTLLPSVRQFAEDLLVSVITVARAYQELERDGLIYRRQGLGTFVADRAADRSRAVKVARARVRMGEAIHDAQEAGLGAHEIVRLFHAVIDGETVPRHGRTRG